MRLDPTVANQNRWSVAIRVWAACFALSSLTLVLSDQVGLGSDKTDDRVICPISEFGLSNEQLEALKEKASRGHAESARRIALFYNYVGTDREASLKWYKRAEELGSAAAGLWLGHHYRFNVQPPDYQAAFATYHKWAILGDPRAMIGVGEMFEEGLGVPKNRAKAMEWYEKAARKGKVLIMEKLSDMLLKDGKVYEAFIWAEIDSLRRARVGPDKIIQRDTTDLARRLTADQLAEAKKKAATLDREIPQIEPWINW